MGKLDPSYCRKRTIVSNRERREFLYRAIRGEYKPMLVFLPGKFQGQRSLVGYSPWGHTELDKTEQLHFLFKYSSSTNTQG